MVDASFGDAAAARLVYKLIAYWAFARQVPGATV